MRLFASQKGGKQETIGMAILLPSFFAKQKRQAREQLS
jgi:hypothetical protein